MSSKKPSLWQKFQKQLEMQRQWIREATPSERALWFASSTLSGNAILSGIAGAAMLVNLSRLKKNPELLKQMIEMWKQGIPNKPITKL